MEWGTKWTPIMPLEEAPQMKKLPDSSQNTRLRCRGGGRLGGGALFCGALVRLAVGPQAHRGRVIAHQEEYGDEHEQDDRAEDYRTGSPPDLHDEPHQGGHRDQLTGRGRSPEDAEDEAPPLHEPAIGYRRSQDGSDDTGAQAAKYSPEQIELPQLGYGRAHQCTQADKAEPEERKGLGAKAVHQPAGGRAGEAVEQEPDRDRSPAPAELGLEWVYEHRRCRSHSSRDE